MTTKQDEAGTQSVIALEFVVGVTGHRDPVPGDVAVLKDQIRATLEGLQDQFTNLPLCVASGLAEGADMLVSEVALELGLQVLAVLPMPRSDYEQDFDADGLTQFQELADDDRVRVVELPVDEDVDLGGDGRIVQYEKLMDFLTRRSNLLLALWDGNEKGERGGTSQVVASYLSGNTHRDAPSQLATGAQIDDCGEVAVWIPTPRQSAPKAINAGVARYLVSDAAGMVYSELPKIPDQIFTRWQGFEGYATSRYSDAALDVAAYPLADESAAGSSPQAEAINREFIRADQLAMANQKYSDGLFKAFGLIAAIMGLAFLVYAKLAAAKIYLVIYVGLFLLGYLLFKQSARRHWFSNHLSYRALAETFRVQYFMLVSGVGAGFDPRRIISLTSVDRFHGFEWLPDAIRCLEPLTFDRHKADAARLEGVRQNWVEDQCSYFSRKLATLHKQHERLEVIKATLMLGSVLGALALILFKYDLYHMKMAGFDAKTWLVFFMGLLPLWLAVWELYQGKMATRELIWQYANQRRYFVAASHRMAATDDTETRLRVVSDLAERALGEIYLWSSHRFHREHEPPAAG